MTNKKIITCLLFCVPVGVHAECANYVCSDVSVVQMEVNTSGTVWVQTSGTESLLSCAADSGLFLKLDASTAGGKNVYSALLASQTTTKKVKVRLEDALAPATCTIAYVTVFQ